VTIVLKAGYPQRRPLVSKRFIRAIGFALCAALCAAAPARAGVATLHQDELNQIFSQASVQGSPILTGLPAAEQRIDIRFNPIVTLSVPSLLTIDTEDQLNQLFALGHDGVPTVDLFFVDSINECGGEISPPAIGCGQEPGNKIAVESNFASITGAPGSVGQGAALIGHELGHTLGLGHVNPPPGNLMNPSLSGNFTLTADQVAIILGTFGAPGTPGSPLVQTDPSNGQRFVLITPFAIVPEPGSLLFALAGGVWVLGRMRPRRAA
jgi:hypothetical protein